MSLGDVEFEEQRERFKKSLEEQCRKACEAKGVEYKPITIVIPFLNDDVPKYLEFLNRLEEESRKTHLMVGYSAKEAA